MSFHRTPSGLSNLRLFYGVGIVVFVEGGPSITADAAVGGAGAPKAADISFWQNVFRLRRSRQPIKFRAVGSKTALLDIAARVVSRDVRHVVVAMDRDYDHFNGCLLQAPGVMYTFGYSWENDVWTDPDVVAEVFYTVAPVCRATFDVADQVAGALRGFCGRMRRFIRVDVSCNRQGVQFLPKESPERLIHVRSNSAPEINRAGLRTCITRAKAARQGKVQAPGLVASPERDCCGHLIECFAYQLVCHLARSHGVKSVPKDLARGIAINAFGSKLQRRPGSAVKLHYTAQLRRLRSARPVAPTKAP